MCLLSINLLKFVSVFKSGLAVLSIVVSLALVVMIITRRAVIDRKPQLGAYSVTRNSAKNVPKCFIFTPKRSEKFVGRQPSPHAPSFALTTRRYWIRCWPSGRIWCLQSYENEIDLNEMNWDNFLSVYFCFSSVKLCRFLFLKLMQNERNELDRSTKMKQTETTKLQLGVHIGSVPVSRI